jgi:uncharacterized protein
VTTQARSVHERYDGTCIVVICKDRPDGADRRRAVMTEHLAYIDTILDRIELVGPLFDEHGRAVVGSLYCLRTTDPGEARALVEADPLFSTGIFRSVEVSSLLPAAGRYVGRKIW